MMSSALEHSLKKGQATAHLAQVLSHASCLGRPLPACATGLTIQRKYFLPRHLIQSLQEPQGVSRAGMQRLHRENRMEVPGTCLSYSALYLHRAGAPKVFAE